MQRRAAPSHGWYTSSTSSKMEDPTLLKRPRGCYDPSL